MPLCGDAWRQALRPNEFIAMRMSISQIADLLAAYECQTSSISCAKSDCVGSHIRTVFLRAWAPAQQMIERADMRVGDIHDMNIVPDAGAVRRLVIVADDADRLACQRGAQHQRRQVAQTGLRQRRSHGAEGPTLDSLVTRGRDHRRLPQTYVAATRRLPLCLAGDHSEPNPVVPASMPQAPRHQPVAGDRRRQPPRSPSNTTQSATSTSTSPRFVPERVSSTASWRLIAHRSSPLPSYIRLPT